MLADDHMVRAGDAQVTTRAVDMARCMAVDKDSRGSCILLNFYIKPQRRDGYRLILRILQPFDDSRNLLSVRRRSRFDVFFRISKNKYSKISQKNSNCWGISGFARSLFPQKFRISPYCLSVTANMLVYPEGGIERLTRLM